ncbi:MAG TPA: tetratricopeptide repeat protein [Lamprocystis sp. (in: g-proteobacteria)]|nr:tetratricopeptide repeat protein [Lamprocystis sp. (in: g-proteobacteria)]
MRLTGSFIRSTVTALLIALLTSLPAWAEHRAKANELPFIQPWCSYISFVTNDQADRNPTPDPETAALIAKIHRTGCRGYWHACWGMALRNRGIAHQLEGTQEGYWFHEAISGFGFVLRESGPACSLIPQLHAEMGETYALLGDVNAAEWSYRQALKAKPGYVKAYVGLSDLFEQQGAMDKAIAVLQEGIKANPASSGLKKKLQRVQARASGGPAPSVSNKSIPVPVPGRPTAATKPPTPAIPSTVPTR